MLRREIRKYEYLREETDAEGDESQEFISLGFVIIN